MFVDVKVSYICVPEQTGFEELFNALSGHSSCPLGVQLFNFCMVMIPFFWHHILDLVDHLITQDLPTVAMFSYCYFVLTVVK